MPKPAPNMANQRYNNFLSFQVLELPKHFIGICLTKFFNFIQIKYICKMLTILKNVTYFTKEIIIFFV